jgi:hypothetical protein
MRSLALIGSTFPLDDDEVQCLGSRGEVTHDEDISGADFVRMKLMLCWETEGGVQIAA